MYRTTGERKPRKERTRRPIVRYLHIFVRSYLDTFGSIRWLNDSESSEMFTNKNEIAEDRQSVAVRIYKIKCLQY